MEIATLFDRAMFKAYKEAKKMSLPWNLGKTRKIPQTPRIEHQAKKLWRIHSRTEKEKDLVFVAVSLETDQLERNEQ